MVRFGRGCNARQPHIDDEQTLRFGCVVEKNSSQLLEVRLKGC